MTAALGVDVHVVVRYCGILYAYSFSDSVDWPPRQEDLVGDNNNHQRADAYSNLGSSHLS